LIFPHWRAGTLPLSGRNRHLFPTAYESPRIRFILVDGDTGQKFPAWVARQPRYVLGLREWYDARGVMPGSLVRVQRGKNPGEVIIQCDSQRGARDWVRTVLVGSDGGIVFALLKQIVTVAYDERMAIAIPDVEAIDQVWKQSQKERIPFERTVVNTVRELSKLNPQSHVHASELYAAINVVRRCPPGPILALLASRPWFIHVGDHTSALTTRKSIMGYTLTPNGSAWSSLPARPISILTSTGGARAIATGACIYKACSAPSTNKPSPSCLKTTW
jgi:hypothetical protein